jgi:hypothetical protein
MSTSLDFVPQDYCMGFHRRAPNIKCARFLNCLFFRLADLAIIVCDFFLQLGGSSLYKVVFERHTQIILSSQQLATLLSQSVFTFR